MMKGILTVLAIILYATFRSVAVVCYGLAVITAIKYFLIYPEFSTNPNAAIMYAAISVASFVFLKNIGSEEIDF